MIQSMTGYGKGSAGSGAQKVNALIKSVNGRFLDIKIRGLDINPSDEKSVRDFIAEKLNRGTIHVNLELESGNNTQTLTFNKDRFESIEGILLEIQKKYGRHLNMGDLINTADLFTYVENDSMESKQLLKAVDLACAELVQMRETEGEKLKHDFEERLIIMKNLLSEIETNLPSEFKKREEKYKNRIAQILDNTALDESRIAQEIAMLAEKADVTEEVVRLKSHFQQFSTMLSEEESAGRRLNFLLQEMSREINTIGSKSSSEKIVNHIIIMKDEAEKMREQVQNIL